MILVVGATGNLGGEICRRLKAAGKPVRGLVRQTADAGKIEALKSLGVDLAFGDLRDRASLDAACKGISAVITTATTTLSRQPGDSIEATDQAGALNLVEAAKAAGVQHVVWSTLEDTRQWVPLEDTRMPTLMGKYKVPHFDAKGEADAFFTGSGVPATLLRTSFYWDNLVHSGMGPKPGPDGTLAIAMPMGNAKLPGIAAEDIGRCAFGVFCRGGELAGKSVGIAGGHLTGSEMASALGKALGEEVAYSYVPPEVYRTFGFPGADDLANMFQFKRDFEREFCGLRDLATSRSLNPELQTFEAWLAANAAKIPRG